MCDAPSYAWRRNKEKNKNDNRSSGFKRKRKRIKNDTETKGSERRKSAECCTRRSETRIDKGKNDSRKKKETSDKGGETGKGNGK